MNAWVAILSLDLHGAIHFSLLIITAKEEAHIMWPFYLVVSSSVLIHIA